MLAILLYVWVHVIQGVANETKFQYLNIFQNIIKHFNVISYLISLILGFLNIYMNFRWDFTESVEVYSRVYRIAGNFRGTKFSMIASFFEVQALSPS